MSLRPRLLLSLTLALTALAGGAGCEKKTHDGGGGGGARPAPTGPVKVALALDETVLIEQATLAGGPHPLEHLAKLPPADTWIAVEVIDQAGKVTTVLAPSKNHAGAAPALSADDRGAIFGLLKDGKLEQPVTAVAKVTVKTKSDAGKPVEGMDHAGGGGGDSGGGGDHGTGANEGDKSVRATPTAELKIEIETAAGTSTFTGDKMVGLPEVKAPTGDTETPGWSLVDVLAVAGLKDVKAVTLTDDEGASLKVEGADFDPARAMLYLKLNRSGVIRFRLFRKTGDVWDVAGELRGIKKIKAAS
jgi:hypothetical protein